MQPTGNAGTKRRGRKRVMTRLSIVVSLGACGLGVQAQDPDGRPRASREDKDEELGERLIREAVGKEEDIMGKIVRLMTESARSLEVEFDPGTDTQALQEEIVDNLDDAIKTAAAQRRRTRQSPRRQQGDKRRMANDQTRSRESSEESSDASPGQSNPASTSAAGQVVAPGDTGGALKETRRAWGHLPERERDELIQGSEEAFLEQYRAWIEMYYKALQEAE